MRLTAVPAGLSRSNCHVSVKCVASHLSGTEKSSSRICTSLSGIHAMTSSTCAEPSLLRTRIREPMIAAVRSSYSADKMPGIGQHPWKSPQHETSRIRPAISFGLIGITARQRNRIGFKVGFASGCDNCPSVESAGRSHHKSRSDQDLQEVVVVPACYQSLVLNADLGGRLILEQSQRCLA